MAEDGEVPDFRAPGWDQRIDLGGGMFLLHWPAGVYNAADQRDHWGFEHAHTYSREGGKARTTDLTDPDAHLVAPLLDAHVVTDDGGGRVTVRPSVLCDCGTHGFITDGSWEVAGG